MFAPGLNTLDGFGITTPLLVEVEGEIDQDSLPADAESSVSPQSSVFLLRFDDLPQPAPDALKERLIPIEVAFLKDASFLSTTMRGAIVARPLLFLEPKARYAFVVTSCAGDIDGRSLAPSETFRTMVTGSEVPPALEATKEELEVLFGFLERSGGVDRHSITMATTFTTMSIVEDVVKIRDAVLEHPPTTPSMIKSYSGADEEGDLSPELLSDYIELAEMLGELALENYRFEATDTIAFGTFESPSYLDGESMFSFDDQTGELIQQGYETLEFIMTIPRPDPENGIQPPYPVVVFQHASIVCKETVVAIADALSRFGLATIGIDAVAHGSRSSNGYGTCETNLMTDFFDMTNFGRTSARYWQSVMDGLVLVRMLKSGALLDAYPRPDGDGEPDLDPERIGFVGQSMGSSMGMLLVTLSPDIGAAVINVGGGLVSNMMIVGMSEEEYPSLNLRDLTLFDALLVLGVQTVVDQADPAVLGQYTIRNRLPGSGEPVSILYQEVIGDEIFPNLSTEITARELGIPLIEPVESLIEGMATEPSPAMGNFEGVTAGLFQYGPPADHNFLLEHEDRELLWAAQLQTAIFLATHVSGATVIVDPFDEAQTGAYLPSSW